MKLARRQFALMLFVIAGIGWVSAREGNEPTKSADAVQRERQARLDLMRRRVMSLTAEGESQGQKAPLEIIETPLLRYSNPAADAIVLDATVWGWGKTGRPSILASVEDVGFEVVSLTDQSVQLTGKSGVKWMSKNGEIEWKPVPGAAAPGKSLAIRNQQMKQISRRFSAAGTYGTGNSHEELRLLERPLYRYAEPEHDLVDGTIFAFVAGTNPEVIMLLECRKSEPEQLEWYCGFTRLSAGALETRLGKEVFWTCPAIRRWSHMAPYSSLSFGKEDIIPAEADRDAAGSEARATGLPGVAAE